MRKFIGVIFMLSMLWVASGCNSSAVESTSETVITAVYKDISFSDNILFSINNGAAGFGTLAECTDAEIIVYTDKSVGIFMVMPDFDSVGKIGTVILSDSDYERLFEIADRERIYNLDVTDGEADDGSSYHIMLYDEKDEQLIAKGGYMPIGEEFWEIYKSIKEILEPYGINAIVDEHRKSLE